MLKNGRLRLLIPLALAIIGLLVIAAGLSNLRLGPGEPTVNLFRLMIQDLSDIRLDAGVPENLPGPDRFIRIPTILIWFTILATLIFAFGSARFRKVLLAMLFFVFLFLVILPELIGRQRTDEVAEERGGGSGNVPEGSESMPPPPEVVVSPPDWLTAIIATTLALVIVVAIWFVWRRLKRLRPDARSELVGTAEQTLAHLDRGADVRDAVLRCYADMTRHFGRNRQLERRKAMTPREFDSHLAAAGMDDKDIHRLTRLFEAVRYNGRASDEPMAQEARACLNSIVSSYGTDL